MTDSEGRGRESRRGDKAKEQCERPTGCSALVPSIQVAVVTVAAFLTLSACALESVSRLAPTPIEMQTPTPVIAPTLTPIAVSTLTPVPTVRKPSIQIRRTPECLRVLSTGYRAENGRPPKVVGEVINDCSSSFTNVTVTVLLVNSLVNLQVDVEERGTGALHPGQKGSFGASWRHRPDPRPRTSEGAWDTVILGIRGVGQSQVPSDIVGLVAEVSNEGVVFVSNDSRRVVGSLSVFRTGYDAEKKVVASDFTNPIGIELEPGQTVNFHLNPSSNPRLGSMTFNYYVGIGEPVEWTVRVTGAFRD